MGMLQLDLGKSAEKLKVDLGKRGVIKPPPVDVGFILDVSGSFDRTHRDGTTQTLLQRLTPYGMVFDPDQKLDVFSFSSGAGSAHHVGDITPATVENYIANRIIDRVPGYNGATDYSYVLEKAFGHFGFGPLAKKGGWFSKAAEQRPSLLLFVTDGANSDQARTSQVLRAAQDRKDKVYIHFIGCHPNPNEFGFLQQVADDYSNTGLTIVPNVRDWVNRTDEQINGDIISDEFIAWLKK